jgi:REP element-mobilizing transposase RayT
MGRIHRYGQEKNCLILNFISTNTREGRVMQVIFERAKRAEDDLDPHRTGKVFNVLGDVFPANQLEKMIRDMYAHNQMTEELIKQRIVEEVDRSRFERITNSTLEGLAKRELNLSAIIGKSAEAKERRLVPEVIEDFFVQAAPTSGIQLRPVAAEGLPRPLRGGEGQGEGDLSSLPSSHIYRVGRVPRQLWPIGERLEPRFGKLGREYKQVVFDKEFLKKDATLEWVTPGHPLFEAVREDLLENAAPDLQRGSMFYDLHASAPYHLDFFAASVKDGRDHQLHRRLFAVQTEQTGEMTVKQPTVLLDLAVAPPGSEAGILPALFQPEAAGRMPASHFKPLNKEAEIHKHRRRLPHWEQDGCTYFVTFRLADAVPQDKLKAWQEEKANWLKLHPQPWSEKTAGEYAERFVERIQKWLDTGYGSCALQEADARQVVENALRHFDGERHTLDGFVLMPNHVHLLVQPMAGFTLSSILHSWKSYTANLLNQKLGRSGVFWLDENFDHAVRSLVHLNHFRQYIAENPAQANLSLGRFAVGRGAGILPALEDSATWRPPAQAQGGRQDACFTLPDRVAAEQFLIQTALNPMLAEVTAERARETETITKHLEISLNELIHRQNMRLAELMEMQQRGDTSQPLAANIKQTEDRIDELNGRLEHRCAELERERECMIGDIQHVARAWVLPHPERKTPQIAAMVADPEIERIAVQFAIKHEEAEGRVVESVESENRGFDLISHKPHPEDPKTAIDVRFIEVKGRADTGDIALTSNEYNTAKRLKKDYYLYIVLHCATSPSLNVFQDPAILDWQPIVKVEHYRLRQDSIKHPVELKEEPVPYRTGGDQ